MARSFAIFFLVRLDNILNLNLEIRKETRVEGRVSNRGSRDEGRVLKTNYFCLVTLPLTLITLTPETRNLLRCLVGWFQVSVFRCPRPSTFVTLYSLFG
jgi:hypothetical protein